MGPIPPVRSIRLLQRRTERPAEDPPEAAEPVLNVTVKLAAAEPPAAPYRPPTNLDAHLIAQQNRMRGLRGGQQVLDTARQTYLDTEWSGAQDRRLPAGRITKTEV